MYVKKNSIKKQNSNRRLKPGFDPTAADSKGDRRTAELRECRLDFSTDPPLTNFLPAGTVLSPGMPRATLWGSRGTGAPPREAEWHGRAGVSQDILTQRRSAEDKKRHHNHRYLSELYSKGTAMLLGGADSAGPCERRVWVENNDRTSTVGLC